MNIKVKRQGAWDTKTIDIELPSYNFRINTPCFFYKDGEIIEATTRIMSTEFILPILKNGAIEYAYLIEAEPSAIFKELVSNVMWIYISFFGFTTLPDMIFCLHDIGSFNDTGKRYHIPYNIKYTVNELYTYFKPIMESHHKKDRIVGMSTYDCVCKQCTGYPSCLLPFSN